MASKNGLIQNEYELLVQSYVYCKPELSRKINDFFSAYFPTMFEKWLEQVRIDQRSVEPRDPLYAETVEYAKEALTIFCCFIENPQDHSTLEMLAHVVAEKRIDFPVNIGEVVSNINHARFIINHFISVSTLSQDDQIQIMLLVNHFLNLTTYYIVSVYTEYKDSIIQEKERFIREMHQDRLSVLGKIAASFAHEFRNPLTAIKGFITLIEEEYKDIGGNNSKYFTIIKREMIRLQESVSQFLLLSKDKGLEDQMDPMCLSETIEEVVEFMTPRFLEVNIEVSLQIEEHLHIMGVKDQLKQVFINIINNAVEELSKCSWNRELHVRLKKEGSQGILYFTNNGSRIPKHLIENIFEPFVTTKDVGTGLGLSVCKQIVEKHQGCINVVSDEYKTMFTMNFPLFNHEYV